MNNRNEVLKDPYYAHYLETISAYVLNKIEDRPLGTVSDKEARQIISSFDPLLRLDADLVEFIMCDVWVARRSKRSA